MCVCANFQAKQTGLTFSAQIYPKMEKNCLNKNHHPRYTSCANFFVKMNNFEFFGPNLSKKDLGLETEKSNIGITINIIETLCVLIFSQTGQLTFLAKILPKMDLGLKIQKTNVGIRMRSSRYRTCQFSGKTANFDFFDPNLPKNEFWGRNFKNLSPDLEFALPRYHVCQFSVKRDNFDIFDPILPKKEIRI